MKPVQLFVAMIAFNVATGMLFVAANLQIWNTINPLQYTSPHWDPININYVPRYFENGEFILAQMVVVLFNYPFWLFWVAATGNVLFAILILKVKKT